MSPRPISPAPPRSGGGFAAPYAAPGAYNITAVKLFDNSGNVHSYGSAELAALGLPTSFTVPSGGSGDVNAPTLTWVFLVPFVATLLVQQTGSPSAPAFYIMALAAVSGIAMLMTKDRTNIELEEG